MKIFEALRQEHEKQRLLLNILAQTTGDTPARREFYTELKEQIDAQNTAEERFACSPLEHSSNQALLTDTEEQGRAEINELVRTLDTIDMNAPEWLQYLKTLQQKIENYINKEEQEFFKVAAKTFNGGTRAQPRYDYEEEMEKELQRA